MEDSIMRKITFITLVMILGMTSVSFGEQEVLHLYKWEFSDGVRWKSIGLQYEHLQYKGETKNGLPHGIGYTYMILDENVWYSGHWENGLRHGEGIMRYTDSIFEGEWKEGKRWTGFQREKGGDNKKITGTYEKGVYKKLD